MKKIMLLTLSLFTLSTNAQFDKSDMHLVFVGLRLGIISNLGTLPIASILSEKVGEKVGRRISESSEGEKIGGNIGIGAGAIASLATLPAGIWLGFEIIGKKHNIDSRVARVAYQADISLRNHKDMLQAAFDKNKDSTFSLYEEYLNKLFLSQNGIGLLRNLLMQYHQTVKQLQESSSGKEELYKKFSMEVGEKIFDQFKKAIHMGAAIWALLQNITYPKRGIYAYLTIESNNDFDKTIPYTEELLKEISATKSHNS